MDGKPTISQWLKENKSDYESRSMWIADCVAALGHTKDAVTKKAKKVWPPDELRVPWEKPMEQDSDIIPADDFLAEVDVVDKINQFLTDTVKDNYIETEKLRRRFDVSQTRWREVVNLKMFEGNIFTFDVGGGRKKTVWSSIQGIEKLKATTSLARYAT